MRSGECGFSREISKVHEPRFELFPWPRRADLLAVIQCRFENKGPAGVCWSVGLLVHLDKANSTWIVRDRYLLETQHHSSLLAIRLVEFGGGTDDLVVESDIGGAGTWGSYLLVFDLSRQKLHQVLETTSRISYMTDDRFTKVLDIPKTIARHDGNFWFTKTTMFENGKPFTPPRVTRPCYSRGADDNDKSAEQQEWLAPLTKP